MNTGSTLAAFIVSGKKPLEKTTFIITGVIIGFTNLILYAWTLPRPGLQFLEVNIAELISSTSLGSRKGLFKVRRGNDERCLRAGGTTGGDLKNVAKCS